MNVNDSEKMAGILRDLGYEKTNVVDEADVIIVNTCSVRAKPDNKAYSFVGNLKALKKKKPNILIAVAGCIPQWEHRELYKRFRHVDLIFGTFNFARLPKLLEMARKKRVVEIFNEKIEEENNLPFVDSYLSNPYVAYITVQRGCNRFCTYCIVPFTRGRERSVKPELVVNETKRLAQRGVKEVHLLGQNVDFYNYDGKRLSDLLYMISEVDGIERIRFTTSHPCGFNEDIAIAMRDIPKVCEYIHLPPQSGSNNILKRMNRGYTREEYIEKVSMLREYVPNVSLSGDFIVGFPGETDEDFKQTLELAETCKLDSGFVFEYSPRPLTKAYSYTDDVPKDVKTERLKELQSLLAKTGEEANLKKVGTVQEVLVEGKSPKGTELSGRTRNNKLTIFEGSTDYIGKFANIRILEASPFFLRGKVKEANGNERGIRNRYNAG